MSILGFTNRFLALERELDLFALPEWDPLRYALFWESFQARSLGPQPVRPLRPLRPLRRMGGRMQRALMRRRLLHRLAADPREVLIVQAPRQWVGGRRVDSAMSPFTRLLGQKAHVIDTVPRYYHLPETGGPRTLPLPPPILRMTEALVPLTDGQRDAAALAALAGRELAQFQRRLDGYRRLLETARPRVILVNQNGMEKPLFRAAHQLGIPVVETQHGVISYGHPAYSYAMDLDYSGQDTLPDVFVTFGPHWTGRMHYPVPRIVPLGNDAMVPRVPPATGPAQSGPDGTGAAGTGAAGTGALGTGAAGTGAAHPGPAQGVMIISGDIYHDVLSDWTCRLAQLCPDRQILYKLHPNQQGEAEAIAAALAGLPNVRVVDGQLKAVDLLGQVGHLVVVHSTVMYEALQLGIPVSVVPIRNYDIARDIFDLPLLAVTATPEALAARLDETPPAAGREGAGPAFFAPFRADAAQALIDGLIRDGLTGARAGAAALDTADAGRQAPDPDSPGRTQGDRIFLAMKGIEGQCPGQNNPGQNKTCRTEGAARGPDGKAIHQNGAGRPDANPRGPDETLPKGKTLDQTGASRIEADRSGPDGESPDRQHPDQTGGDRTDHGRSVQNGADPDGADPDGATLDQGWSGRDGPDQRGRDRDGPPGGGRNFKDHG